MADNSGVLVVVETSAGSVLESSLELLTPARELASGGQVSAVVIGHQIADIAADVAGRGADRVLAADHPELERYSTDGYSAAIDAAVEQTQSRLVLLTGTTSGRDLGPYLAARSGSNCISDCVALRWDGEALVGTRPVYQGKMLTDVSFQPGDRGFAIIRSGAFDAPESSGVGEVEQLNITLSGDDLRVRLTDVIDKPTGDINLEDAEVVICGGRGLGSEESFSLVFDLAEAFDGAYGATRAVTDLGWRPHYEQIGQTGKKIKAKLYIGVGVSGAVQHTVGMQNADTIVAINRDPDAPIFKMAEIGVIGDLHEIVPALVAEVRAARGK